MTKHEGKTVADPIVEVAKAAVLANPKGLGTSAARLADQILRARTSIPELPAQSALPVPPTPTISGDPAYAYRPWGDGTASPLYCPVTERINEPLGAEVDDRLAVWAKECGFTEEESEKIRKAGFGRLVMLAHTDSDDPDRLLIGAKMNAAWWITDDYYCDDSTLGAIPEQLPPRLIVTMAAMDPVPPAGEFTAPLDEAIATDRVLVTMRSAVDYLAHYSTPAQYQRVCYSTFAMFVSWTGYAAWRHTEKYPPVWKYIAARQHDSFYTSMTLIDSIGGYELEANLYYDQRVRRAAFQAGTATVIANDLFSVAKDLEEEKPSCNMVLLLATERSCTIDEAREITVKFHNDLVHDFEASCRALQAVPSVELQRFLRGLRAWMGGSFEWHNTNPRYQRGKQKA